MSITINVPFDIVVALAILLLIALTSALIVLRKGRALFRELLALVEERDRKLAGERAVQLRDQAELLRR